MKDPAALLYIDKYLIATAEMDADCVGWYTKLLLHQYDKGSLPNCVEKLASLCNVRFSEYERFKQVFEQVLKQKFKQNTENRLEHEFASDIIKKRENYKEKRANAGIIGSLIKKAVTCYNVNNEDIDRLKEMLMEEKLNELNKEEREQMLKQMLKQINKLYINVNINKDIDNIKGGVGEKNNLVEKENGNKKSIKFDFKKELLKFCNNEELVNEWMTIRAKKKAINSEKAFKDFLAEVGKACINVDEALAYMTSNGRQWKGFESDWYINSQKNGKTNTNTKNNNSGATTWSFDGLAERLANRA